MFPAIDPHDERFPRDPRRHQHGLQHTVAAAVRHGQLIRCACNPDDPQLLTPVFSKRSALYSLRRTSGSGHRHRLGCRHFDYSVSALASHGLEPRTIVKGKQGRLTLELGSLFAGGQARSASGEIGLAHLAKLFGDASFAGDWRSHQPVPSFWARLQWASRCTRARHLGALSDFLLIPTSGCGSRKDNRRMLRNAHAGRHGVLLAVYCTEWEVERSAIQGHIDLTQQLGAPAKLSHRAITTALTCDRPARASLEAGVGIVLLALATAVPHRQKGEFSACAATAAVMAVDPRWWPVRDADIVGFLDRPY